MKREQVIDLQLVSPDGQPIRVADVCVNIDFHLNEKYRYGFRLGPTDADGHLRITYDDIEGRRRRNLALQPWDYQTHLEDCDAKIQLAIPSQNELDEAARIATLFNLGIPPPEAAWWSHANNRNISCVPVTVVLDSGTVAVNMICTTP
jgi:hypothetical protein